MPPILEREPRTLPLAAIDLPEVDARIDRDSDQLEELGRNIARIGLIQPIHVFTKGERYELVDGACRVLASRMVGLETIDAYVYPSKLAGLSAVKYAANAFRLEPTAADEAMYFYKLYAGECEQDIEKVCAIVNRKLPYVDGRLQLLLGDELVFEALKAKQITIGVAQELNKCSDPQMRRHFLHHAVLNGASIGNVGGWVMDWKRSIGDMPPAPARPQVDQALVAAAAYDPMRCYVCRKSIPGRIPESVMVHGSCREAILDPMLAAARGETAVGPEA